MTHLDHRLGALAVAGDWACAHAELDALGDLARDIAERVREPLHCDLVSFADRCAYDPQAAVASWPALREQLYAAVDEPARRPRA